MKIRYQNDSWDKGALDYNGEARLLLLDSPLSLRVCLVLAAKMIEGVVSLLKLYG